MDQPLPLPWYKWPLPCVVKGSQMSPKILRLECDQELGPRHPKSHWEFWMEPGPSTSWHNHVCTGDAEGGSIIICSLDNSDEDNDGSDGDTKAISVMMPQGIIQPHPGIPGLPFPDFHLGFALLRQSQIFFLD